MRILDWLQVIASSATAVAVFLAWWQLHQSKNQATTNFEDTLTREYREISRRLPLSALLGKPLSDEEMQKSLPSFFSYIDLSNEEVFLRQQNRISEQTWKNWCDGIKSNLRRPAFEKAWQSIRDESDGSFQELRRLIGEQFSKDPAEWGREHLPSVQDKKNMKSTT